MSDKILRSRPLTRSVTLCSMADQIFDNPGTRAKRYLPAAC